MTPKYSRYPFKKMDIGQSFLIPGHNRNVHTAASICGKRNMMRFTVSKQVDGYLVRRVG